MRDDGITLGNDEIMLLGVMCAYVPLDEEKSDLENINIAQVCPIDYLVEILDSSEARSRRGE